jgi:nifR3 family TIM-barrel protein
MVRIGRIEVGEFPLLLAPMEDVSDPPFRALCKRFGADVVYTEFISSEGLIRQAAKSLKKLDIYADERPVGIQIFGGDLDAMTEAAAIAEASGPDIIDINYGCPVKKVVCKDAGAAILQDIPKMVRLTDAIVKAVRLPVTVKTRLGWDDSTIFIEEVVERLQDVGIKAISIHGRTRAQMYKGEADWTRIGRVKANPRITIPVFGNGDVSDPQKMLENRARYGVDGVMIGRASIGSPWVFREMKHFLATGEQLDPPGLAERVEVCKEHVSRAVAWKGEHLGIIETRRHYGNYFRGYAGVKEYRNRLVVANNQVEVFTILDDMVAAGLPLVESSMTLTEAA